MKQFGFFKAILLALLFALLFSGCPPTPYSRSVQDVKSGILVSYTDRRAFVDIWGPPDSTRLVKGESILNWSVNPNPFVFSGNMFVSDKLYDVWEYKSRETTLFFDGYYLINWITNKTTHELRNGSTVSSDRIKNDPIP